MHILNKYQDIFSEMRTHFYFDYEAIEYIMDRFWDWSLFIGNVKAWTLPVWVDDLRWSSYYWKIVVIWCVIDIVLIMIIEELYLRYSNDIELLTYLIYSIDNRVSFSWESPLSDEFKEKYSKIFFHWLNDYRSPSEEAYETFPELRKNKKMMHKSHKASILSSIVLLLEFDISFTMSVYKFFTWKINPIFVPTHLKYERWIYKSKFDINLWMLISRAIMHSGDKELWEVLMDDYKTNLEAFFTRKNNNSVYIKYKELSKEYFNSINEWKNPEEDMDENDLYNYLKLTSLRELTSDDIESNLVRDWVMNDLKEANNRLDSYLFNLKISKWTPSTWSIEFTDTDLSKFDKLNKYVWKYWTVSPIHTSETNKVLDWKKKLKYKWSTNRRNKKGWRK